MYTCNVHANNSMHMLCNILQRRLSRVFLTGRLSLVEYMDLNDKL